MGVLAELLPIDSLADDPPPFVAEKWTGADIRHAAIASVPGIVALAALALFSIHAYLYIPYSDPHAWIAALFSAESAHDWRHYIWGPHNNQRIPTALLVEAWDIDIARGRSPSFLIAGGLAWALGTASLLLFLMRAPTSNRLKAWLIGWSVALLASVALAEDFAFPVFSVYPFVTGPALAAVAAFQHSLTRGLRSPVFWLALLLALAASCGNAAGLAIWPTLCVMAVMQRRDAAQMCVLIVAAALVFFGFQSGIGSPGDDLKDGSTVHHLIKMAEYFAIFGGLPWTGILHPLPIAAVGGAGIWSFALWTLMCAGGNASTGGAMVVQVGKALIIFGLITATLATAGRVDELPQPIVPTRYTPFATLLQLGILLGSAEWIEAAAERVNLRVLGAGTAIAMLLVVGDIYSARWVVSAAKRIRAASLQFDQQRTQGAVVIYRQPSLAIAVRAQLKARGLPY